MAYPEDIDIFREIENLPGLVFDPDDKRTLFMEDLQAVRDSIIAIESFIGTEETIFQSPLHRGISLSNILDIAERSSNATTTSSSRTPIPDMSLFFDLGDEPAYVRLTFGATAWKCNGTIGHGIFLDIYDDDSNSVLQGLDVTRPGSNWSTNCYIQTRPILFAPGEHNIIARFSRDTDGTLTIVGSSGSPIYLAAEIV